MAKRKKKAAKDKASAPETAEVSAEVSAKVEAAPAEAADAETGTVPEESTGTPVQVVDEAPASEAESGAEELPGTVTVEVSIDNTDPDEAWEKLRDEMAAKDKAPAPETAEPEPEPEPEPLPPPPAPRYEVLRDCQYRNRNGMPFPLTKGMVVCNPGFDVDELVRQGVPMVPVEE